MTMAGPGARLEYRPLHAPHEDRSVLVEPPFSESRALVEQNLTGRREWQYDLQGRPLEQVARQARRELLREARRWTSSYRDVTPPACGEIERVFLAGHQPQLFHPGVWFKNLALDWLARRYQAVAVNLLVDSDTMKTNALRVPGGTPDAPRAVSLPLDRPASAMPYEERRILDRAMFADFGRRVTQELATLVPDPLIRELWPLAVDRARRTDNLGACLAQSRHLTESGWGLNTLEVPQSRICQSESFAWLVAHVLAQLPRFRQVYNEVVAEYRRVNRIRNAAHPVPDLAADGEWLEAPFWIWTAGDPVRRPLYAARQGKEIRIGDRQRLEFTLPLDTDLNGSAAAGRLMELSGRGVKIRSRALITTLWARLALGDLFLHGIGGAKYDQVTDGLIVRFFGLEPPGYMVLSATLHLPVDRPPQPVADERSIHRQLRELDFHPERHLDRARQPAELGNPEPLVAEKLHWIRTAQTPANARERYVALRRVNQALQPWVARQREHLIEESHRRREAAQQEKILGWREYAFCLYPEQPLRDFLFSQLPS
jgi:hypothetical protein